MPDGARLIAAMCICGIAYVVSQQIMSILPETTVFGSFVYVNTVLGAVTGWVVMGKRAGRGFAAAVNNGLGGALVLVLWGLFVHSCYQMFERALNNWYNGFMTAMAAIFQFMAEFALILVDPMVLTTLLLGGIASGLLTEYAWRVWR